MDDLLGADPPEFLAAQLGARVRDRRLDRGWTQQELAERAGVPVGTLKRFEHTGHLSLASVLRLAVALDALEPLVDSFQAPEFRTLDEAIARQRKRQRGRRT